MSKDLVVVKPQALDHLAPGGLRVVGDELQRGNLRAVRTMVRLDLKEHVSDIQGRALLTPDGAMHLNQVAGISWQELKGPGYTEMVYTASGDGYERATRTLMASYLSATGTRVYVGPVSYTFVPAANLNFDLHRKASASGPVRINYGQPKPDGDGWELYRIDHLVSLWINRLDKDVCKAFTTYLQDKKFAPVRALHQGLRNLLCQCGLPKHPKMSERNGQWSCEVPVIAWQAAETEAEREVQQRIKQMHLSPDPRAELPAGSTIIEAQVMETETDLEERSSYQEGPTDAIDTAEADNPGGF